MLSFTAYDFVIFDLDGTLYDEDIFLKAAYKHMAHTISLEYNLNVDRVESFLVTELHNNGRTGLFDKVCLEYGLPDSAVGEMLSVMRSTEVNGGMELYGKMEDLLKSLIEAKKKLFIITNGTPIQQQKKVKAIHWHGLDQHIEIVYANSIKPKPDRASFDFLVDKFGVVSARTVFIGDSETDSDFAQNSGIAFIHVDKILLAKKYKL